MRVINQVKSGLFLGLSCLLALSFAACTRYSKEITTGQTLQMDNVYANPAYAHGEVLNVLVLPFDNPLDSSDVERYDDELVLSLLRNLGKFHYFNVQYDSDYEDRAGPVINVDTGEVNRVRLGAVGELYQAQAVLKVAISDYQIYPPMRMRIKGIMVDTSTGDRIWQFDQTFDADDTNVVNSMRKWWNTHRAGSDQENRFEVSKVRRSFFSNYAFYSLSETYGRERVRSVASIEEQKNIDEQTDASIRKIQKQARGYGI